jgi:hypothetical protein
VVSARGERERVKRAAVAVGPGNRGGPAVLKKSGLAELGRGIG